MIANRRPSRRPGTIMPVVALLMVCLCGFTALSVEVATIATVKVQCQNAADSAALAGARTLNGGTTSNTSLALTNALAAASGNSALGLNASSKLAIVPFTSAEVTSTCGTYHYNTSSQSFYPAYTLATGENYNLVSATVQRVVRNTFFAVAGGVSAAATTPTVVANAVAAHRPRDVAIVLDFSSSMNDESDLWYNEPFFGSYNLLSNNADPNVPKFGHYSDTTDGAMVSSSVAPAGSSNSTISVNGMPILGNSYFATAFSTTPSVSAFTAAPNSYATAPLGDIAANQYLSPTYPYVTNVNDFLGGLSAPPSSPLRAAASGSTSSLGAMITPTPSATSTMATRRPRAGTSMVRVCRGSRAIRSGRITGEKPSSSGPRTPDPSRTGDNFISSTPAPEEASPITTRSGTVVLDLILLTIARTTIKLTTRRS